MKAYASHLLATEELEGVQNRAKTDIPANTRCKHVIPAQKFTPLLQTPLLRTGVRAQAGPRRDAKRGLATHRLPLPVENRQHPRVICLFINSDCRRKFWPAPSS